MTRRTALIILALLLGTLLLVGCGDGSASDGGSDSTDGAGGSSDTAEQSIKEYVEQNHADTEWYATIDRIVETRKLRHPVTEFWFGTDSTDEYMAHKDALNQAIAEMGLSGYHVDTYGPGGSSGGFGSGSIEGESVTLPEAPADIGGLSAWMDEAYGPGSGDEVEEWYGRITGYDFETDAWDGEKVIVVRTDLVFSTDRTPDKMMADLISLAVASSGLDWATDVRVVFGDGNNVHTGGLAEYVPYSGY